METTIINYLEDRDIDFHTEGKNVSQGWINVPCPFCDDPSWHLGINLESGFFHCWICGEKGPLVRLVQEFEGCSLTRAEIILSEMTSPQPTTPYPSIGPREISRSRGDLGALWPDSTGPLARIHKDYLRDRGFNPDLLAKKYNLKGCIGVGRYKFRIVAPVILKSKIVNFVALDTTGKARSKYLFYPNDKAILPIKSTIYNIDSAKNSKAVIVEGITDVWRIGDGAVAIFGKAFSQEQVKLLQDRISKVLILLDSDAEKEALSLAAQLSPLMKAEIALLDSGDPCDMDSESLKGIHKWLK